MESYLIIGSEIINKNLAYSEESKDGRSYLDFEFYLDKKSIRLSLIIKSNEGEATIAYYFRMRTLIEMNITSEKDLIGYEIYFTDGGISVNFGVEIHFKPIIKKF